MFQTAMNNNVEPVPARITDTQAPLKLLHLIGTMRDMHLFPVRPQKMAKPPPGVVVMAIGCILDRQCALGIGSVIMAFMASFLEVGHSKALGSGASSSAWRVQFSAAVNKCRAERSTAELE